MFYSDKKKFFYFGNKATSFATKPYKGLPATELKKFFPFSLLSQQAPDLIALCFLKQVHGILGYCAGYNNSETLPAFTQEGDFLITNRPLVALGVVTADCLPLVVVHKEGLCVGIAHLGWKGAVQHIALELIKALKQTYNIKQTDLEFFLGPSAGVCCYKVDTAFIATVTQRCSYAHTALTQVGTQWFFNLPLYTQLLLQANGIHKNAVIQKFSRGCTICDLQWCSYRRDRMSEARQMSVVLLKS